MFGKYIKITTCLLSVLLYFFVGMASAQGTKTVPISVSDKTQLINNKEYYIHIVESGQTVFSIARAYGLKYYDAVIKTDIHLMKVGDTVWLPKNENSVAAVSAHASSVAAPENRVHYIKVDAGQTLYSLAREYGVTVDQIVEANPELKNSQLKAGQMLKIPPKSESVTSKAETEVTAKQKAAEEAAKQKAAEEAAKQRAAEEAAKQRAAEEAAKQKATDSSAVMSTPLKRPVVNPYPFAEVPDIFPTKQAPYFNFTTSSSFNYQVRERQDKERLFVTVVMPLNLDKINEISTSKFDIEQRGKKEYKVFEFIQFYEGILMALDQLQSQGMNIVLNVVDLTSDNDDEVAAVFQSHSMANSDFIIALLVKKPFNKLAELAKQHQVFVINPFSSRVEVVDDNPYVVKYMPSVEGTVKSMLDIVASKHRGGNLYLIHSGSKGASISEREYRQQFTSQLEQRGDIKYTIFDWTANSKLLTALKSTDDNVIISIYDQDKNKNIAYTTALLNRLSALTSHVPTLMTVNNILADLPNPDYDQLQHLFYTTATVGYLDYNNVRHKSFIDTYKEKFRTEPNSLYAGVAFDIMTYFSTALWTQGAEFWRNPQRFATPSALLFPFALRQISPTGGYENQSPDLYQMINYKLIKAN